MVKYKYKRLKEVNMKNTLRYGVGDHVMYMSNGVCRIDELRTESFGGAPKLYYVMHSLSDTRSVIYVPTDSEPLTSSMLELLSREQIDAILAESNIENEVWIADTKARAARFTELLSGGDRAELVKIIRILGRHKTEVESQRKKFYVSDERILNAATKAVTEEFSFVLGIEPADVVPYILERVK